MSRHGSRLAAVFRKLFNRLSYDESLMLRVRRDLWTLANSSRGSKGWERVQGERGARARFHLSSHLLFSGDKKKTCLQRHCPRIYKNLNLTLKTWWEYKDKFWQPHTNHGNNCLNLVRRLVCHNVSIPPSHLSTFLSSCLFRLFFPLILVFDFSPPS